MCSPPQVEYKKILMKVWWDGEIRWEHFCYVRSDIYLLYFSLYPDREEFRQQVMDWCKDDFGVSVKLNTKEDIQKFKNLVSQYYKHRYQALTSITGSWFRAWLTNHMENEVQFNE